MARKPARKTTRKTTRKKFGRPGDNPTAQRIMRPIEKNESLHRMRKHKTEPTDIEKANAAGVQYAEDQLQGDYFMDWVREQMFEASRMPEDKVLPLETKSDAKVIAKNMLQQLEWDAKRDLRANDIESLIGVSRTTPDVIDAFFDGFGASLELARDWLADELLEINQGLKGGGRGVMNDGPQGSALAVLRSLQPGDFVTIEARNLRKPKTVTVTQVNGPNDVYVSSGAVRPGHRGGGRIYTHSGDDEVFYQATMQQQTMRVSRLTRKAAAMAERHPSGVREHDTVDDPFYVIQGLYSNGYLAGSSFGYDDEATAIREAEKLARSSYFEGDYVRIITRDGELVWSSQEGMDEMREHESGLGGKIKYGNLPVGTVAQIQQRDGAIWVTITSKRGSGANSVWYGGVPTRDSGASSVSFGPKDILKIQRR